MATIRQNVRFGAAFFVLFATGCLSPDEALFRSVAGPEERTEPLSPAVSSGLPAEDGAASRGEQLPGSLDLDPSMMGYEPSSSQQESPVESDEAGIGEAPFDPCAAPGLLSCDTFEDVPNGQFPSGEPWLDELPGCGTHVVDEEGTSPHGSKALRAGGGGYPECMLHMDLQGEEDVFVRSWIRLDSELLEQYVSLLEWGPEQDQDEPEVRIGSRPNGGSLCPTAPGLDVSVSGLTTGPATDCTGFLLEPERWYCVQAHVARTAASVEVSLSVDGETLLERSYANLNPPWEDSGFFFKLGRAAYGASGPGSLWHDGVAVGLEPPPCGPMSADPSR